MDIYAEAMNLEIRRRRLEQELKEVNSRAKEIAPKILPVPDCTCRVSAATGIDLPDCPQGLRTGRRYKSWAEVPDEVLRWYDP